MFLVFLIIGVVIMVCMSSAFNKDESAPSPSPARPTPPPVKRFDENDPDDIIKAIGLLAECIASHGDASFYVVFENDNRDGDNRRIIIFGSIDDWANNFSTKTGSERWRWLSAENAAFLDTVPFTFEGDKVHYTYFTTKYKPIGYRNSGVAAVKQGIARARFRHDSIKIEESQSSIMFFCN